MFFEFIGGCLTYRMMRQLTHIDIFSPRKAHRIDYSVSIMLGVYPCCAPCSPKLLQVRLKRASVVQDFSRSFRARFRSSQILSIS